jgi:hypothetical protein
VTRDGNRKAQQLVAEVFELRRSFAWRGLGELPYSALRIRKEFADFDAERRFGHRLPGGRRPPGLRVRRHPARRQAAAGLPDLRQRVHAGEPDRLVHGVVGGRLCRALLFGRCRRGGDAMSGARKGYVRPLDLQARPGRHDARQRRAGDGAADRGAVCQPPSTTPGCGQGNDQAVLRRAAGRLVMATDAHVVSPLFFPGGDIGCLSVHGTINDVAMGARPLYLARPASSSRKVSRSPTWRASSNRWRSAARAAGVPVVTGDTKVVEQGKGDGVFITTTGVGVVPEA